MESEMKNTQTRTPFEQDLADKRAVCGAQFSSMKKACMPQIHKLLTETFEQDIHVRKP